MALESSDFLGDAVVRSCEVDGDWRRETNLRFGFELFSGGHNGLDSIVFFVLSSASRVSEFSADLESLILAVINFLNRFCCFPEID